MIIDTKILTFIFLYIILISLIQTKENIYSTFKCNIDSFEEEPLLAKKAQIKNTNSKQNSENEFKNLNIYLDLSNFEEEIKLYNLSSQREFFITGLNKAINTLQFLLKVKPPKNYIFYDEMILEQSIKYWNKTLIGNQSLGMADLGIDLYIFVRFGNNKEMGNSTLALARAKYVDPETGQPLIGVININKDVDYIKVNSLRFFELFILHEMTHVLGFDSYFFKTFFHNLIQKNDYNGIQRAYINSTKVVHLAKQYFNCSSIEGVELEDFEGAGKVSSHWESRILLGDYMNAEFYNEEEVISEFTLALLEDTGYYQVKYYTGGLMQFGKNKGCEFLYVKCVNDNGKVNKKFKNEFFDLFSNIRFEPSCSSGRQSRIYHFINEFNNVPKQYQYYFNDKYGGRISSDYCPVSQEFSGETQNSYYIGRCSQLGNGDYGTKINYNNADGKIINYKSSDIKSIIQEKNFNNSFCVLSSLISKNNDNYKYYSNTVRAVCYQMYCSDRSLTLQINNDYIVCPREGGKIKAINFDGYLLCPDYYLICSGTVLCNDLFDCVEKKSTLKDDIIYDYESRTSQDLEMEEISKFSEDSYEQSINGKCPLYCSQCNELGQCFKCKNDYAIVEIKEKESIRWECKLISELNIGYYKNNETYYKCMDYCDKCSNSFECEKCELDSNYVNKKCIKNKNCKIFKDNEICEQCEKGYAFEENDKSICKNIDFLKEHFTKDNGINYFRCNNINEGGVGNCSKCDYNNSHVICVQCKNNFILIDDENKCYNNKTFKNNKAYYYIDSYHLKTCSKTINNCEQCIKKDKNFICQKCFDNYYFVKNGSMTCNKTNEIEPNEYYYYNIEKETYYLCGDSIDNCKKCNSSTYCNLCKNGFILINNNKTKCQNISKVEEDFSKDLNDNPNNIVCDIENCDTCSSYNICSTCKSNYALFYEKNKCVNINDNHYYINYTDKMAYYCSQELKFCETCSNYRTCEKCFKDYYILNSNKMFCYHTNDFNHSLYFLSSSDDDNYILCSNTINYCETCDSNEKCNSCKSGYIILDDDFSKCHNKIGVDLSKYFTEDNIIYNSCESIKYRNNIRCFGIIKNQVVTLKFIQVQIINNHLFVYMLTHSLFPKNFSLKITFSKYNNTRLRHLEDNKKKSTTLTASDDSDGKYYTIIRFTSDEIFNDTEDIQISKIEPNDDILTKIVTENNNFKLEFNPNSREANTKNVKSLINEKKIPDLSSERNIIRFSFNKTEGCELNFNSEMSASISENQFNIDLVDNLGNIKKVKCDIKQANTNSINCKISEEVENDYTIKDDIKYSSDNLIIFSGNGITFKLICKKEPKIKKLNIIFIIVIVIIVCILIIVCVIYVCFSKKLCHKKEEEEENNGKNDKSSIHDISSSTTSRKIKKK